MALFCSDAVDKYYCREPDSDGEGVQARASERKREEGGGMEEVRERA